MRKLSGGFRFESQRYEYAGTKDHETLDGRLVVLHRLRTGCPACKTTFTLVATKSAIRKRQLRRRCDSCKAPGVPVVPKPARRSRKPVGRGKPKATPRARARPAPLSALVAGVFGAARRAKAIRAAMAMLD